MEKLKVILHYPEWKNRWEPYVLNELSKYDLLVSHTVKTDELIEQSKDRDVCISMWCNGAVGIWTQHLPEKKIITYLRRFELWNDTMMNSVDFNHVDAMVWVNEYYARTFSNVIDAADIQHWIIPNGIDLTEWNMQNGCRNPYKIALIASMKHVKNIPLAAQILSNLPDKYHLHHIGLWTENFTGELTSYVDALGLRDRWHWEPTIPREKVQEWLSDKGCLLNSSINEGNPNCVIEAMAMGIKPVIHAWPGAYEQFPEELVFKTVDEACAMIREDEDPKFRSRRTPQFMRDYVEQNFSLKNFEMLHNVIESVMQ